uniref:Uncharacterized protein n=1 Tax=Micrurus spixii TaxID=129469 RepID=A0A2D4MCP3_9SAUR
MPETCNGFCCHTKDQEGAMPCPRSPFYQRFFFTGGPQQISPRAVSTKIHIKRLSPQRIWMGGAHYQFFIAQGRWSTTEQAFSIKLIRIEGGSPSPPQISTTDPGTACPPLDRQSGHEGPHKRVGGHALKIPHERQRDCANGQRGTYFPSEWNTSWDSPMSKQSG